MRRYSNGEKKAMDFDYLSNQRNTIMNREAFPMKKMKFWIYFIRVCCIRLMLVNPPSRVEWVRRDENRHRSKKRFHSDRIVRVRIRPKGRSNSTKDGIPLKNRRLSGCTKTSIELNEVRDRSGFGNASVIRVRKNSNQDVRTKRNEEEMLTNIEFLSFPKINKNIANENLIEQQVSPKSSSSPINPSQRKKKFKQNLIDWIFFSFLGGFRCALLHGIPSSLCRILISIFAILVLCGVIAALIMSILNRPKDTIITRSMVWILWNFNNNTRDAYNTYNGELMNNPTYVTGYTGLESEALGLNGNLSQYVKVDDPRFEFTYRSFTIEIWFYPTWLTGADFGLFGHCKAMDTDQCLTVMIRKFQIYAGFYNGADDLSSTTNITINRWYHVAFAYDYSSSTQFLYLNGNLEGSRVSNKYQAENRPMTIGATGTGPNSFFFGSIEQVSITTIVKTASDILYTATFVCHYSFDTTPYMNTGPWNLTSWSTGLTAAVGTGRVNDAVSFISLNNFFLIYGLSVLGTKNQAYSIALWIKPTSVSGGSILYVSRCNTNCALNWCMPFIGFTLAGRIVLQSWSATSGGSLVSLTGPTLFANVWTHIVYVYSPTNGLLLYLNGILFQQSSVFSYLGSGSANYIYFGSFPLTTCSQTTGLISATQYYGIIDEFYLFARELTITEVNKLANPSIV